MPTYRGINISLQTQYDARSIPEYPPLSIPLTPSPRKEHPFSNINTYKLTPPSSNSASSALTSSSSRTAEVYIPIYPGAQFWIHYLCPEPPPHVDDQNETKRIETHFFYFKLFLRGKCVLSWGVGEEDGWAGKLSFGVYGGTDAFNGRRVWEKRGFFFKKEEGDRDPTGGFEIRVFRSRARRREETGWQKWEEGADGECGFRLTGIGRVKRGEPKRTYTYALIDPVDQPYAVFRYHCRTASQLEDAGFDLASGYQVEETPVPSPDLSPRSEIHRSPPAPAVPQENLSTGRLSYPPGIRLSPTKSRVREGSPVKKSRAPSPPRDAVDLSDLSHHFKVLELTDEDPTKSSPSRSRPAWVFSKPLPDVPSKRDSGHGRSISRSTSNVAETFKGFVQNRLKRRVESRDETATSSLSF